MTTFQAAPWLTLISLATLAFSASAISFLVHVPRRAAYECRFENPDNEYHKKIAGLYVTRTQEDSSVFRLVRLSPESLLTASTSTILSYTHLSAMAQEGWEETDVELKEEKVDDRIRWAFVIEGSGTIVESVDTWSETVMDPPSINAWRVSSSSSTMEIQLHVESNWQLVHPGVKLLLQPDAGIWRGSTTDIKETVPLVREIQRKPVNSTLIVVCSLVWFYLYNYRIPATRAALQFDAVYERNEKWRMVTSALSHIEPLHALVNMSTLATLGELEVVYGSVRYLTLSMALICATSWCHLELIHWWSRYKRTLEASRMWSIGYSSVLFSLLVDFCVKFGHYCIHPALPCFETWYWDTSWWIPGQPRLGFNIAPLILLGILQVVLPNVSFFGHLSGIIVGHTLCFWNGDWMFPSTMINFAVFLVMLTRSRARQELEGSHRMPAGARVVLGIQFVTASILFFGVQSSRDLIWSNVVLLSAMASATLIRPLNTSYWCVLWVAISMEIAELSWAVGAAWIVETINQNEYQSLSLGAITLLAVKVIQNVLIAMLCQDRYSHCAGNASNWRVQSSGFR